MIRRWIKRWLGIVPAEQAELWRAVREVRRALDEWRLETALMRQMVGFDADPEKQRKDREAFDEIFKDVKWSVKR